MVIYHVESYSGIPRQARFQEEQIIRKKYHNQIQVANGVENPWWNPREMIYEWC